MSIAFRTQKIADYAKEFVTETDFGESICSICLSNFIETEQQSLIWTHEGRGNNRHAHHIECLTPWLDRNLYNKCPCCNLKNVPTWKQLALKISKKTIISGLGMGLMIGALGFLNNASLSLTSSAPHLLWNENNTLFLAGLTGGLVESLLICCRPAETHINQERQIALLILTTQQIISNARTPILAISATGAMFLTSKITNALFKAGVPIQGLAAPMVIAGTLSTITSALQIPLPVLPLTAFSTCLGIIGSLKKDE